MGTVCGSLDGTVDQMLIVEIHFGLGLTFFGKCHFICNMSVC